MLLSGTGRAFPRRPAGVGTPPKKRHSQCRLGKPLAAEREARGPWCRPGARGPARTLSALYLYLQRNSFPGLGKRERLVAAKEAKPKKAARRYRDARTGRFVTRKDAKERKTTAP
jgi:hypothetical protein